jgi:hypothetical protein
MLKLVWETFASDRWVGAGALAALGIRVSAFDALCYEHEDRNAHDLTAANIRDLSCQRDRQEVRC